tara:strand:+ start:115 stop:441 length:327 start_codon:yes stop_codon:yes gene_type:complete
MSIDVNNLTSEMVLSADITELADCLCEANSFRYTLTPDERGWLLWIQLRYAISELIVESLESGEFKAPLVFNSNSQDVNDALKEDDVDRVPCLSEDTALARLIWVCGG